MHIYAFGSLCRGEITFGSDIDMLALVTEKEGRFDPNLYSIYSYTRISELWAHGNPFAWHLALESRLIFASDGIDHIKVLGAPALYRDCKQDCIKFSHLYNEARQSMTQDSHSVVFDLSTIFLSLRNFATCYSLGITDHPNFSRYSALSLPNGDSVDLSREVYTIMERARILATRGLGEKISELDTAKVFSELNIISVWMARLIQKVEAHEQY